MNNYLLQLLKDVKTLIIPGLGALTITNESTGEILFMPYLKFDDGTLAKHIAEKENIDENEAKNMIAKFVREVTTELDKGQSYDMYQFGSFSKDAGEVVFKNWSGSSTSTIKEEKAETKSEAKPEVKKEEIKPIEEPTKPQEKTEVKPKSEDIAEEKPSLKSADKSEVVVETPSIVVESPNKTLSETKATPTESKADKKPIEDKTTTKPVVEAKKITKEKPVKPPKTKKQRSNASYVFWGVLIIIIGFGIYVAVNFNNLKKDFPILAELAGENDNIAKGTDDFKTLNDTLDVDSQDTMQTEPIVEDQVEQVEENSTENSVQEPEVKKSEPKKEDVKKPSKQTTTSPTPSIDGSKSYHIIAGSFGSETNANRLAEKLRADGFAETAVAMHSGMYRVSIKGFSSLSEANAEIGTIRNKVSNVWVMKM